eukprot:c23990_g12_i2 orf=435-797(-)
MPMLYLHTNLHIDALLTSHILLESSAAAARILGKPDKYVMVLVESGVSMWCDAGEEPAAWAELVSIGGLTSEETENIKRALIDILEAKLCVHNLRFWIHVQDVKQNMDSDSISCLHAIHQ